MSSLPRLPRTAVTGTDLARVVKTLKASYQQGMTLAQLAAQTGRSKTWIKQTLIRAGIEMRPRGRRPTESP